MSGEQRDSGQNSICGGVGLGGWLYMPELEVTTVKVKLVTPVTFVGYFCHQAPSSSFIPRHE